MTCTFPLGPVQGARNVDSNSAASRYNGGTWFCDTTEATVMRRPHQQPKRCDLGRCCHKRCGPIRVRGARFPEVPARYPGPVPLSRPPGPARYSRLKKPPCSACLVRGTSLQGRPHDRSAPSTSDRRSRALALCRSRRERREREARIPLTTTSTTVLRTHVCYYFVPDGR